MKRQTALGHVRDIAETCVDLGSRLQLLGSDFRPVGLWVYGPLLDEWDDRESFPLALVVNLEPHVAHWLSQPAAADWLMSFSGWAKRPVSFRWRSHEAPVWNHEIIRPAPVWTATDGVSEELLADLAGDRSIESYRLPAPTEPELSDRMTQERAACLTALQLTTDDYWERRWGPGKPFKIADPLAQAATGLLDVEAAIASR